MFYNDFSTLLEDLAVVPGNLIVTRDFNFHVDDPSNSDAAKFLDMLSSAGLDQKMAGPTHKHGHTLDVVIVPQGDSIVRGSPEIICFPYSLTDHHAVICTIDVPKPLATKIQIQYRKVRNIDVDMWCNDILDSTLYTSCYDTCTDVNILTDQYNTIVCDEIDKHAPT